MCGKRRGQTTLDFAAGMSAFLLVFAFTLTFVPGMLQPFTEGSQEETVVADRIADQLVEGMLGDSSNPYHLDVGCTNAFFNSSKSDVGCEFSNSTSLHERLGLAERLDVHIQLRDSDSAATRERDTAPVPDTGSVVVARRTARANNDLVTVIVRVW